MQWTEFPIALSTRKCEKHYVLVKLLRCSQLRIVIHVHVEENNIAVQTFFYNNAIQISLYIQTSAL